jgi:hypothetical protein
LVDVKELITAKYPVPQLEQVWLMAETKPDSEQLMQFVELRSHILQFESQADM